MNFMNKRKLKVSWSLIFWVTLFRLMISDRATCQYDIESNDHQPLSEKRKSSVSGSVLVSLKNKKVPIVRKIFYVIVEYIHSVGEAKAFVIENNATTLSNINFRRDFSKIIPKMTFV